MLIFHRSYSIVVFYRRIQYRSTDLIWKISNSLDYRTLDFSPYISTIASECTLKKKLW